MVCATFTFFLFLRELSSCYSIVKHSAFKRDRRRRATCAKEGDEELSTPAGHRLSQHSDVLLPSVAGSSKIRNATRFAQKMTRPPGSSAVRSVCALRESV